MIIFIIKACGGKPIFSNLGLTIYSYEEVLKFVGTSTI